MLNINHISQGRDRIISIWHHLTTRILEINSKLIYVQCSYFAFMLGKITGTHMREHPKFIYDFHNIYIYIYIIC